jgi:ATP-dependent Lon protease
MIFSPKFFDLDQQQREYFLQQQMKTIQEERWCFSRRNGGDACKIKTKKWDEKTQKEFRKELSKCRMNPQAPDFGFKEIIWSLLVTME